MEKGNVSEGRTEDTRRVSLTEQLEGMKENDILIVPIMWEGQKDE